MSLGAVVTRHSLALDDTRWIGAGPDGAGTTVLGVAVRVGTAVESVALHNALKTAAFRSSRHLHLLTRSKDLDRDLIAQVVSRGVLLVLRQLSIVETEAAKNLGRHGETRLGGVADDRLVSATAARRALAFLRLARVPLLTEAELD